jgi:hypothetical protein
MSNETVSIRNHIFYDILISLPAEKSTFLHTDREPLLEFVFIKDKSESVPGSSSSLVNFCP